MLGEDARRADEGRCPPTSGPLQLHRRFCVRFAAASRWDDRLPFCIVIGRVIFCFAAVISELAGADVLNFGFRDKSVTIGNVSPGSEVRAFACIRERPTYYVEIVTRESVLQDDAKSGSVEWLIDKTFPLDSVWFAVDMTTGASGASGDPDHHAHRISLTIENFVRDGSGRITQLRAKADIVWFVVVRPGRGAWELLMSAAGPLDDDSVDPSANVDVRHLRAAAGTNLPPPDHLTAQDVVFIHRLGRWEYGVATVGADTPVDIPTVQSVVLLGLAISLAAIGTWAITHRSCGT